MVGCSPQQKFFRKTPGPCEFTIGKIEDYETPEERLKRELCEELEITLFLGDRIGQTYTNTTSIRLN
jgi:8-oxo-dGTP pyrophosphatase MutT (NUDIX family)